MNLYFFVSAIDFLCLHFALLIFLFRSGYERLVLLFREFFFKRLPSSCTAFPQAFTVNRFRWLIREERPGKALIFSLGRHDPKRFDDDEIQRPRNQAGQTLCFSYTNAWDKLGCLRWANEVIRSELYIVNVWIVWGKMWRKLCKLYFLPNVKSDYVKKLAPFCFIWNGWKLRLGGFIFQG